MHFDNLYNGNKELGDSTNAFLNENWIDVFTGLRQVLLEAFSLIFQNILNAIFKKIPYDDLFLN